MEDKKAENKEPESALNDRELEAAAGGISEEQAFHDQAPLMICKACSQSFTPWSLAQQKDGRCLYCYTNNRQRFSQPHYITNPPTTFLLIDIPDKKQ